MLFNLFPPFKSYSYKMRLFCAIIESHLFLYIVVNESSSNDDFSYDIDVGLDNNI